MNYLAYGNRCYCRKIDGKIIVVEAPSQCERQKGDYSNDDKLHYLGVHASQRRHSLLNRS